MRRTLPLAIAFAAVAALPGQAAPMPTALVDPKGDWPVAGQDFTAVRVATVTVAGRPALRAEIDLVAAPGAPTTFAVNLGRDSRCEWWSQVARDFGAPVASAALERRSCTSDPARAFLDTPDATAPATVEMRGSTAVLTAPYAIGLARGVRLDGVSAVVCSRFVGFWSINPLDGGWTGAASGDYGWAAFRYVLK